MTTFLNADKTLSPDGQKLVEWLDAQCAYAERLPLAESVNFLNTLSGPIKQYYINVAKLKSHTSAQWLEDFGKSWAQDAWRIMEYTAAEAAKAQTVAETATKADRLETELAAFKESLTGQVAKLEDENKALRAKLDALTKKPVKKADAEPEPETDAEAEAEA